MDPSGSQGSELHPPHFCCSIVRSASLMGFGEREMSGHQNHETSAVMRASRLPLVHSALQTVTSAYSEVKGRYPLLGMMGGVAEVGVRSATLVVMKRATPLLQSLEPQIEVANNYALVGLDQLERTFPILHQSTDEVVGHLKDSIFLTLDDMQVWMVDSMDVVMEQLERLTDAVWVALRQLQESQVGQAATSGLDDVLSRLEDATAYYLPLPPTLRREWEMRVQEYEDEDDDDEPSLWTRIRSLLLNLSLQLYHRMMKVRDQLEGTIRTLGDAVDAAGLGRVVELSGDLLQYLQSLLVALVYRTEGLRELAVDTVKSRAVALSELRVVRQARELPEQVQKLISDLMELTKLLVQLVINATPLYTMFQQPSEKDVEDFLNQENFMCESSSRRSSGNNLFLKAMDGRPRRRRSLYRAARGSGGSGGPQSPDPPSGRRSSLKQDSEVAEGLSVPSANTRRPSATDLLLAPLKQFVSQSQKAFEYLNPNSSEEPAGATAEVDES